MTVASRARGPFLLLTAVALALTGCTSSAGGVAQVGDAGSSSGQQADLPDLADCPEPTGRPATGQQVLPELTLDCLDAGGGVLALGQAPGVPMVVNLWASWCAPCREELPLFEDLQVAADPAALRVVGVASRDNASFAADLVEELGLTFANAVDDNGDLMVAGLVRNLPATMFIDADGGLVFVKRDAVIDTYAELVALVQEHLGVRV